MMTSISHPDAETLVSLLRSRAAHSPDLQWLTFLVDGEQEEVGLTFGQLDRQARAMGAALQARGAAGERVVLLYPPGPEYVSAFMGCLYAGAIAVPSYPPDPARLARTLPRLQAMVADAGARFLLTTELILSMAEAVFEHAPELKGCEWIATDALPAGSESAWRDPGGRPGDLAFLQYTSGSTGTPRGVCLSHANLLYNSKLIQQGFEVDASSRGVIWLPPYHDMGLIGGILQPIYTGLPVVLLSPLAFLQKPLAWLRAISRYRATASGGPNFAYDLCVRKSTPEERAALDLRSWEVAFCGAEPIRKETLDRFARAFEVSGFNPRAFYPCYGLAEATLIASGGKKRNPPIIAEVDRDALEAGRAAPASSPERAVSLVGCGQALEGQRIVIANPETGRPAAPGEVGEIWLQGPSVALGYWRREEQSARTFQARLAGSGEGPFLRTGDLGFLKDGELFVTGRLSDLIIVRGRNHYPQDIEATVERSHPAMRPGCGAAFSVRTEDGEQVVMVQEIDRNAPPEAARAALSAVVSAVSEQHGLRLHAAVLIRQGSVPKTSSGKVQRSACRTAFQEGTLEIVLSSLSRPEQEPRRAAEPSAAPVPRNEPEMAAWLSGQLVQLASIPVDQVELGRSITSYGLDSLQAVELQGRIQQVLGVSLPLAEVLRGPSLFELTRKLLAARSAPVQAPPVSAITAAPPQELSEGERALWFLQQMAPESAVSHLSRAVRLRPDVDPKALRRALQHLVDRHPALRTTYPTVDGQPVRRVHPQMEVAFQEVDAVAWSEEALAAWLADEAHRPFHLDEGPLLRVSLVKRPSGELVLMMVVHHIIIDFWSVTVLLRELAAAYASELRGEAPQLPPLQGDYSWFVGWQKELLKHREEALVGFWKEGLRGAPPAAELHTDRRRPPIPSYQGAVQAFRLDAGTAARLKAQSREAGATLFSTLLAAFSVLLQRYSGEKELVVGTPTAGREHPAFADMVGYFVNLVPLRVDLSGAPTFAELAGRVHHSVSAAVEHQSLPFVRLVERIQPRRDPSRAPVFQVAFALMQPHAMRETGLGALALGEQGSHLKIGELEMEGLLVEQRVAQLDLSLVMAESRDGGLAAMLEYNTRLFERSTLERMARHMVQLLEGIAAGFQQRLPAIPWVPLAERECLLGAWSHNPTEPPGDALLYRLVEIQAARTPEAVAVEDGELRVTYGALNQRANRLARRLRALGVGPDVLVGVCMERSLEAVVALLAVLKAGGAFVPLDPGHPVERLSQVLRRAGVRVLLTHARVPHDLGASVPHLLSLAPQEESADGEGRDLEGDISPDHLAYVIHTSGSTGEPKGVMIPHRAISNRLLWGQRSLPLGPADAVLHAASLSFDVSIWEIFTPLLAGGRLVIAPSGNHHDAHELVRLIQERQVTMVGFVPALLKVLVEESGLARCTGLRYLFSGGESLPPELALKTLAALPALKLFNFYGPAETTIDATFFPCTAELSERTVPIGRAVGNARTYVLDAAMRPVPVGVPGELYVGGLGVARGYLGLAELTAERFVPDPFCPEPGARMYRTGDRVRYRADGHLEFLGRVDRQVKLRGLRLELGEVEAMLVRHPAVKEAVTVARRQGSSLEARIRAVLQEIEPLPEAEVEARLARMRAEE
jgi:amino acid adenylation domain-containing protein